MVLIFQPDLQFFPSPVFFLHLLLLKGTCLVKMNPIGIYTFFLDSCNLWYMTGILSWVGERKGGDFQTIKKNLTIIQSYETHGKREKQPPKWDNQQMLQNVEVICKHLGGKWRLEQFSISQMSKAGIEEPFIFNNWASWKSRNIPTKGHLLKQVTINQHFAFQLVWNCKNVSAKSKPWCM